MAHATSRIQRLSLLAILLLAFCLRVHRLGAQSLWYDEAVTAQVSAQGIAALTRWTADDIQPPLYYYAVAGWTRLAGRSEWALRFPSAFFGTLTVALMWAAARRLFGRGRGGRIAAWVAPLLTGISPLYVYYAQEARMYTLLTGLGVLAGYALLRTGAGGEERRSGGAEERRSRGAREFRWWVVFGLAAVAMLYTHYFGVFLLLAYGICWLAGWLVAFGWRHSARPGSLRDLAAFLLSALAIIVFYLPWLPAMLTRYGVDASYWQGALKLNEALRHAAISFTTGAPETMLEADAVRLLPWFGLALIAAALALALLGERRNGGNARQTLVYLFACLLVPILSVLFLASRTPKFNPRYLMLASPAYLLILAGGVGALGGGCRDREAGRQGDRETGRQGDGETGRRGDKETRGRGEDTGYATRNTQYATRNTQYALRLALALLLTAFLVATSLAGLRHWFTDPAFTKAQWRELVATVRAQIAPDEAVLLVSGHASPAWDYYAPDIPRTRLPDIDVLDVNAVLGFDSGAALAGALAGKSGAWLVTWQDDVVDPVGFVPYFLDRAGTEQPVGQQFWHLGLHHWRTRPDAIFPAGPQPAHVQDANFDHKLELLGWDDPQGGRLTIYWRALNTLPADYQVSLILEAAVGGGGAYWRWDGRPAGYDYPTTRWQPGQALFGRYPLPLPPDVPPGDYFVTLAVYDAGHPDGLDIRDVADNPAGKRVRLGPIRIER